VRAARNVQRSDKIMTLVDVEGWSLLPDTPVYSLSCGGGGFLPPDVWADFVAAVTEGKRCGQNIALDLVEREMPAMAEQLKAKGLWPRKWAEGDDGKDGNGWRCPTDLRPVAVKLVDAQPPAPHRPAGPDGLKLDAAAERKLHKMDEKVAAERAKHTAIHSYSAAAEEEAAAFTRGATPAEGNSLSIEAMATLNRKEHEELTALVAKAGKAALVDEKGQDRSGLLTGMKLIGPDGELLNTACQLNIHQAKDKVHAGRDRRFWVYKTKEEWEAADAAGLHDCCIGSLVLVKCGLMNVVLARVLRQGTLKGKERTVQKSMTLEPLVAGKQYFKLELCVAEEMEMDDHDVVIAFRSSGRQIADCDGARIVRVVSRSSLHPVEGSEYATVSRDEAIAMRSLPGEPGARVWLSADRIDGLQALEAELQLPDASLCFMCHHGWSDESTGPLLKCKGECERAFHLGCYPQFEQQCCAKCAGTDTAICWVCDLDVADPDKSSDYYTGDLVQCESGCERWFHQCCHTPPITDAVKGSPAPFGCCDCQAGRAPPPKRLAPPKHPAKARTQVTGSEPPQHTAAAVDKIPATTTAPSPAELPAGSPSGSLPAASLPEGALTLELTYGEDRKLGFSITPRNIVDKVHGGGSADKAGLQEGDVVIAVSGVRLMRGTHLVSLLPKGQQGQAVSLSVMRTVPQAAPEESAPAGTESKRKRTQPARLPGMTTLDGVRLADGAQTHMQRLTRAFAGQTGESI
jgi:hypothetical protein